MLSFVRSAAVGAALALGATAAHADVGIVSFTGGTSFPSFNGTDITVGFQFSTANAISVTGLGWYAASGTVNSSHQVGIWTTSGTLLGSTTVTAGTTGAGNFRFATVPGFALAAGSYFVGGVDTATDNDSYVTSVGNLVTGTGITFTGTARSGSGSGFAVPSTVTGGIGRFGPNFQYTVAGVPEPASWALLIVGFGAIGTTLRSRSRTRSANAG